MEEMDEEKWPEKKRKCRKLIGNLIWNGSIPSNGMKRLECTILHFLQHIRIAEMPIVHSNARLILLVVAIFWRWRRRRWRRRENKTIFLLPGSNVNKTSNSSIEPENIPIAMAWMWPLIVMWRREIGFHCQYNFSISSDPDMITTLNVESERMLPAPTTKSHEQNVHLCIAYDAHRIWMGNFRPK